MPKQFGPKVVFLIIAAAAVNLAGCRTTTNKLAGIPGMGWLEREDETWAKYEPSPGLPRPSDSFDPTPSSAASSIASQSAPNSSTRPNYASNDSGENKQRFDASRYSPKGSSKAEAPESHPFGNYASAYGKYGPPKSTNTNSEVATQTGPYDAGAPGIDVGNSGGSYGLANSTTSGYKAYGDNKFVNPGLDGSTSQGDSPTPSGFAANSRYENSATSSNTPGTDGAAAYVASNSRFGGSVAPSQSPSTSTYTPPGFVSNSASLDAARDYLSRSTAEASAAAENAIASGKQSFNRYAESATQNANSYLQGAQQNAESTARNAIDTGAKAFNKYLAPAATSPAIGGIVNPTSKPSAPINAGTPQADGYATSASRFGNDLQSAATNALNQGVSDVSNATGRYAQDIQKSVQNTVSSVQEQAGSQVQSYADAARSRFDQAATSTYQQASSAIETAEQRVRQYANNVADSARTAVQNVSAPIQSVYPSTNAPNPFAMPSQVDRRENGSYPAPASSAPATSAPASATPGPATMQRSSSPFQPGSTSSFQGAVTARKQTIELASAVAPSNSQDEQAMILAVGDKYQFPGTWR